jgi:hypothetical protein
MPVNRPPVSSKHAISKGRSPGLIVLKFTKATEAQRAKLLSKETTNDSPRKRVEPAIKLSVRDKQKLDRLKGEILAKEREWKDTNQLGNDSLSDTLEKELERLEEEAKKVSREWYVWWREGTWESFALRPK